MQPRQRHITVDEYLAIEEGSEVRHEYRDGYVIAVAGGSFRHVRIVSNLTKALIRRLPDSCESLVSDMRVKVSETRYNYPDVVVYCGEPEVVRLPRAGDALANPVLVIEVLSETTTYRDLVEKYEEYTGLASVQAYWIVAQEERRVIRHDRRGDVWVTHSLREGTVDNDLLGIQVPFDEIFANVE